MIQSLWRTIWRSLKKNRNKNYHISQQSHYWACPEKTITEKDRRSAMFIAALSTIARTWEQPRCSSTDKWTTFF